MKRKAPGILPPPRWLRDHGYAGLETAMRYHPELFTHIRQHRVMIYSKMRPISEWLRLAKQLVRAHGHLPSPGWLIDNHPGLYNTIRRHPGEFSHIKQDRVHQKAQSSKHWISVATRLVKEHGSLPNYAWLKRNRYFGIINVKRYHAELLAHLKESKPKRCSPKEWVLVAEELEKAHGTLPCVAYLVKNKYSALLRALYAHPRLFLHIKRHRRTRTVKEWVACARQLVIEHGSLPRIRWLNEHSFAGLVAVLYKYPEAFVKIKRRQSKGRTPKEWAAYADKLVKKHGDLPKSLWLNRNGCSGLVAAMRKHPELFARIKRKSK